MDTQTNRQTHIHTQVQTNRQTDRKKHTGTHRDRDTYRDTVRPDTQTHRHTQTDRQTDRHTNTRTHTHTHKVRETGKDRKTDKHHNDCKLKEETNLLQMLVIDKTAEQCMLNLLLPSNKQELDAQQKRNSQKEENVFQKNPRQQNLLFSDVPSFWFPRTRRG